MIRAAGITAIVIGVIGLVVGSIVIDSLTSDLRSTLSVSRSAVRTISETVELAAELGEGTTEAMASASRAASSAASATRGAVSGIRTVSSFLETELPGDIEAIHQSLPGAIRAADAIDSTLGALSFIGLDYRPDEPFGDSLRRIQTALEGLPSEVRAQSDALDVLAPAAEHVASDVDTLAGDLDELRATLVDVDGLADSYSTTVEDAQVAVTDVGVSFDRTVLALRIMLVLVALGAVIVGCALIAIDRTLIDMVSAARARVR